MGLLSALSNAVSGLTVNQAQMDIISRNVANAGTVGYSRRVLGTRETSATGITAGAVRQLDVDRVLDQLIQRQLRSEATGASYSTVRADYLKRVDAMFGQPGNESGINQSFANFSTSIQQLALDPASPTARLDVLSKAQGLTTNLNSLSNNVQLMRGEIEARISNDAQQVNGLLDGIELTTERINTTLDSATMQGLLDERDRYIDELSSYFDIRVMENGRGNFSIYTTGGAPLFIEGRKLRLQFDERFVITPESLYDPTLSNSGVGHLVIRDPVGVGFNMTNNGSIRSGSFAALLDLRDNVLPETQLQLDEFAAAITTALGDTSVPSTPAAVGPQQGFDIDLSNIQSGNVITLEYTTLPAGTRTKVSLIAVNNPAVLPLAAGATADPNDVEFGIDFSGGIPAAIAAIGAALGAPFTVSNPVGNQLRILDDGAGNTRDVNSLSLRRTNTGLVNDWVSLPFFVDGSSSNQIYSGSFDNGPQKRGFAQTIRVNASLLADPSRLVVYQTLPTQTPSGDPLRPSFLRDQLQTWQTDFAPSMALTGSTASYRATASVYLDRIIATQSQSASNADAIKQGQEIVVATLRERFAEVSGVQTDKEMGDLVEIQNIYSANARIVSAVREMFDALLRI